MLDPARLVSATGVNTSLLALTLDATADSRSAADGLPMQGTRPEPIASILRMSDPSLAALLSLLACTLGVGGVHGRTLGVGVWRRVGGGVGGLHLSLMPVDRAMHFGLSVESLRVTSAVLPPSTSSEDL